MDILGDAAGALGDEIELDLTQSPTPSPSVPPSRRGSIAAFQRRDSRAATPVSVCLSVLPCLAFGYFNTNNYALLNV